MTPPSSYALNPGLDPDRLADDFARRQRISIDGFLDEDAARGLLAYLVATSEWRHVIKGGDRVFETPSDQMDAMPAAERRTLDEAIFREATAGFQFRYDTIRVPDSAAERALAATPLSRFAEFMASEPILDLFRRVTGQADIRFADAQATRYRRGDFLTRHDDSVGGKHRTHAFVLGLSEAWLPEWGGLLLFNDAAGGVAEAITPAFNRLNLFAVGQPHSVSYVAPYAAKERVSVTGWLRTQLP